MILSERSKDQWVTEISSDQWVNEDISSLPGKTLLMGFPVAEEVMDLVW